MEAAAPPPSTLHPAHTPIWVLPASTDSQRFPSSRRVVHPLLQTAARLLNEMSRKALSFPDNDRLEALINGLRWVLWQGRMLDRADCGCWVRAAALSLASGCWSSCSAVQHCTAGWSLSLLTCTEGPAVTSDSRWLPACSSKLEAVDGKQGELAAAVEHLQTDFAAQEQALEGIGKTCAQLLQVGAAHATSDGCWSCWRLGGSMGACKLLT